MSRRRLVLSVLIACALVIIVALWPRGNGDHGHVHVSPSVKALPQPTGTPSRFQIPEIVWADGVEPTSELEDHPLVRAAREADLSLMLAWNTGDFATDLLMRRNTARLISLRAQSYSSQGDDPLVYPYTRPWQPLEILVYDENGGTFSACFLEPPGLIEEKKDSPGNVYDRSQASIREISMIAEDGKLKYDSFSAFPRRDKECDGSIVPVGFFDPAPELPPTPVTKPVKPPLFADWENLG